MIAVDTNVLVCAHREDVPQHHAARAALAELATRGAPWAVPWPCVHEFLAVVTHRRVFDPPSSLGDAVGAISDLLALAGMRPLAEAADHADVLFGLLTAGTVTGPKVHDARIAAICLAHGVATLWTADRDFSYFPQLRTHNPLLG
ncbi:MAG: PIN domain-containing protein [Geodermatophilaceae bacterium]|nr:PIN domain-containing protein [Geodermatophilaceae bacterium]